MVKNKPSYITTACSYDCGGRCLLKVRVRDGKIETITSGNTGNLNISACPRGLVQKEVCYSKKRILEPLKRIGSRGEGKFTTISWDEALDIVSKRILNVIEKHGTESIYYLVSTGSLSAIHNSRTSTHRFFSMLGKCTNFWGNVSFEGAVQSSLATFGSIFTGSTRDSLLSSKLIILWGWNPSVTRLGSDTLYYLKQAKKEGTQIICVDPRKNKTCENLADEWISIRPGTDTAMLLAMAYVMIDEKLCNMDFIEKHTSGFKIFRDYLMGNEDKIIKNPQWAAGICGISPENIVKLARKYSGIKPAALITGWAPGRSKFGEQYHRAASVLAAMTANIGNKGGFVAGGTDFISLGMLDKKVPVPETEHNMIHKVKIYDAIINGTKGNYAANCHLLYIVGCNMLNQYPNLNKGIEAMKKSDFTIIHELFMTPTAKFADIVLPVSHFLEKNDIALPYIGGPFTIFMNKAENNSSAKTDFEIFSELAKKVKIECYNDKSDNEWMEYIVKENPGFPELNNIAGRDICPMDFAKPHIAFKNEIEDPNKYPFQTFSGKIEIYSKMFEDMKNPLIPPIPKFIPAWKDFQTEKYPISLISPHSEVRINSQLYNIDKIKSLKDDFLWINKDDASKRGIKNGDKVYVYNDRGKMAAVAKVTDKIIPGTASMDQGQWYNPDKSGTDLGGCTNVLTLDEQSPAGALPSNSCLVEIKKTD